MTTIREAKRKVAEQRAAERIVRRAARRKHWRCFWTRPWGHVWERVAAEYRCAICDKVADSRDPTRFVFPRWPR